MEVGSDFFTGSETFAERYLGNVLKVTPNPPRLTDPVRIRYLPGAARMEKTDIGNWIDCYVYEDYDLKAGEFALLNLGFAMEIPQGYEAILAPRSSTFKRFGCLMTNSIGVIDTTYSGNDDIWMMPVLATRDVHIEHGSRLCQFRLQASQPTFEFEEVDDLGNKTRGGFGSTGV